MKLKFQWDSLDVNIQEEKPTKIKKVDNAANKTKIFFRRLSFLLNVFEKGSINFQVNNTNKRVPNPMPVTKENKSIT
jgi:hypothetical protein